MVDIDDSVMEAARKLFLSQSYDSISIATLCKEAHVSRSAFYTRFNDKENLFERIVRADFSDRLRSLRSGLPDSLERRRTMNIDSRLLNEWVYHGFIENKEFYRKLLREQPALLQNSLIRSIEEINAEVLRDYKLSDLKKEYMAYFFAANHAMLLIKWIGDDMKVDARELSNWYFEWSTHYWNELAFKQLLD